MTVHIYYGRRRWLTASVSGWRLNNSAYGALRTRQSAARIVGRFLPIAIYSQMDSPQECQSNKRCYGTNAHATTL